MRQATFLLAFLTLGGCVRGQSDSEVIAKLEHFDGEVFIMKSSPLPWQGGWTVSLQRGKIKIEGEGFTLARAYAEAMANKEKVCADWQ